MRRLGHPIVAIAAVLPAMDAKKTPFTTAPGYHMGLTSRLHGASAAQARVAATFSTTTMSRTATVTPHREFLQSIFNRKAEKVKVDTVNFDKETLRYRGSLFGMPADTVIFYVKLTASVVTVTAVLYVFLKGYVFLSRFSLQTVARMGFMGGFVTCMICYTTVLQLIRRSQINASAVYNQSIALVMHNEKVQQFLGSHPRTGDFKSYCATGGFKLPLLRRIRSGSYELSDLLGLKQRRLQMLFVLKNPGSGHEGVVSCDVRKESTGFMTSTNYFNSLSITLTDGKSKDPETIILIGRPEDVVYRKLLR